jgi:hypothetical protein
LELRDFESSDFRDWRSHIHLIVEGKGSSYPANYQDVSGKTEILVSALNIFADSKLLDVGSNFGLFSLLSAKYCRTVTGLEREEKIFEASGAVKEFLAKVGYRVGNVEFYKGTVSQGLSAYDFDSMLLSLVLYHMNDSEIGIIGDALRNRCERVVIQARPGRKQKFQSGSLTDFVSNTTLYNGLISASDNVNFLRDCGFSDIKIINLPHLYDGEDFPLIVGAKSGAHSAFQMSAS